MNDTKAIIERAHSAFNRRDIDGALALMTPDVTWPRASEGGTVVGKEAIRAYWTRQWAAFDPYVEPLEMTEKDTDKMQVRVHQLVESLQEAVISDCELFAHIHYEQPFFLAMNIGDEVTRRGDGNINGTAVG